MGNYRYRLEFSHNASDVQWCKMHNCRYCGAEQLYAVTRPLMALFIISPFVVVGFLVSFFFLILHFNWHFDLSSSLLSQIIFFSSLFDCILLADIATHDRETTISLEFTFTVQSGYPYLSHRSSYIKTNQNRSYLLL